MGKIAYGKIQDGKFIPLIEGQLQSAYARYEGQHVKVEVKSTRAKSSEKLGYYWGSMIPEMAEEFGYKETEYDQLHTDVKMKVWHEMKTDKITGEEKLYPRMLREDNDDEMGEFIQAVVDWMDKDFNFVFEPPNKNWKEVCQN